MRLAKLLGADLKETLASGPEALREKLDGFHDEDIAEIVDELPLTDAVALMKVLPNEFAADVLERLEEDRQLDILRELGRASAAGLLVEMDPDDRVDAVQGLEPSEAKELLDAIAKVEPEAAAEVRELRQYGEETAGGLMTTDYVSLEPDTKIWQAIERVRKLAREGEAETISYVYVCAYGGRLLGVVSLRDLILKDPSETLEQIMTERVVSVEPNVDQEKVALLIAKYDLTALPVVGKHGKMLGLVTVDDVVDVVIEEATEDAQKMGGVVPLEDSYLDTGLFEFAWKRGMWLILLFLAQLLTATVMEQHETTIAAAMALVVFVPLIISSGGNSGAQSSTLIIRALAVGEVTPQDWVKVFVRELIIGLFLGALVGLIGFLRAFVTESSLDPVALGLAVSSSILAVVVLGTLVGAILPLAIRRLGFDPAVSSTPFVASVVDVLGLVVYFQVAQWIIANW